MALRKITKSAFEAITASRYYVYQSPYLLARPRSFFARASLFPNSSKARFFDGVSANGNALLANFSPVSFSRYFYSSSLLFSAATSSSQANPSEFTEMAWEGVIGAVDAARASKQQVVETEHLMKALLEQKDGLARRIFTKAGVDHTSVLQATDNFISQQPKVMGDTSGPVMGSNFGSLLDNARKHKREMGDDFVSVEHFVLAFHLDKRFGQQLLKSLQLNFGFLINHQIQTTNHLNFHVQWRNATSSLLFKSRPYTTGKTTKSIFESNILRILHNELEYQTVYAPPHKPETKFDSFVVEDQPGEQWMTMRRTFNDTEDIKLEVTMFDGFVTVPKLGEDSSGEDVRLHLSVLVDVSKLDGGEALEFVCSAWPDCLEIQKVYLLTSASKMMRGPYLGPDFRSLNSELKQRLREFLEARGVNDQLSVFLHQYMVNKDRIELIRWLQKVESFVEK